MPRPSVVLALLAGCNYLGASSLDRDGDGVLDPDDCDHSGPRADQGSARVPVYRDSDGDGFGDPRDSIDICETAELPDGYVANADDCNDANAAIHPAAVERCLPAGIDDDCDGGSEDNDPDRNFGDDASLVYPDPDEDGFPSSAVPVVACAAESDAWIAVVVGAEPPPIDCAPADPDIHPAALEIPYNDVDEDCDGIEVVDVDGDGAPGGPDGSDCDDADPTVHPDALERCNTVDDDCDGLIDDDDLEDLVSTDGFYLDADMDGWPSSLVPSPGCEAAPDRILAAGTSFQQPDCDDTNDAVFPGAPEVPYDSVDEDCDGVALVDVDGDGQPAIAAGGTDCDDTNAAVLEGAVERCNGFDDDCDGLTDDDDPELVSATSFFADADRDGAPDALVQMAGCDPGPAFLPVLGASTLVDCDPTSAAVRPGATEIPYNGVDEDCSGADLVDVDGDGFSPPEDCQDDPDAGGPVPAADIHPGAEEVWYDGVDQDCDGANDHDRDGDGFSAASDPELVGLADCDDLDPEVFPGAVEDTVGVDADCDGLPAIFCWADADDDAFGNGTIDAYGNPTGVNQLLEVCPAGFVSTPGDCDDSRSLTRPFAVEICDGRDNDCDGHADGDSVTLYDAYGEVLQHLEAYGGYGGGRLPVDASHAAEVAICSATRVSLDIDAGDISGRTVWMHGVEIGDAVLEDSVIRATANAGQTPGVLVVEDLIFQGAFTTDDVIRLNAVTAQASPNDLRHRLRVQRVLFEGVTAERYIQPTGALLEIEDLVANGGSTSGPALDASYGGIDAALVRFTGHRGPVLEMQDGTVARLELYQSDTTADLVTIRGNGVITNLDAEGGSMWSLVRVTPGATATVADASLRDLFAFSAPIVVDDAALTFAGSALAFTSGTDSGGIVGRDGSIVTVAAASFYGGIGTTGGGAVTSEDSFLFVTNTSFNACSSPFYGGAVGVLGGSTVVRDSVFSANQSGLGGAIKAISADVNLIGSNSFYQNSAAHGGALYVVGDLTADVVSMYDNAVTGYGGGLHLDASSTATLSHLTGYGNLAPAGGQEVYVSSGELSIGTLSVLEGSASMIAMGANSTLWVDDIVGQPVVVQMVNPLRSVSLQVGGSDLSLYCAPSVPGCECADGCVGYGGYGYGYGG